MTEDTEQNPGPRLAIIGLDGATWEIINPLIEQGKLPAIEELINEGKHGELQSVIPPVTPPAWATMLTGCNPGEHGIFEMRVPDPEQEGLFRPPTMADWHARPIWRILNDHGLTTGFFAVPFTFPPPTVDGWMVSGIMGTPQYDSRMCNPPELYEELCEAAGEYAVDRTAGGGDTPVATMDHQIEWIRRSTLHLLRNHPVDVFMTVANYTDHVGHHFLQSRHWEGDDGPVDLVEYAYRAADDLVASIREELPDDCTVVLVSDHGMGPIEGYINLESALNVTSTDTRRTFLRMIWKVLTRVLPRKHLNRLKRKFVSRPGTGRNVGFGDATLTLTGYEGAIRVSAADEAGRTAAIDELMELLGSLEDPDGQPVIRPYRREELFQGPYADRAPDIIAWPATDGMLHIYRTPKNMPLLPTADEVKRAGLAGAQSDPEGWHRLNGIFATSRAPEAESTAIPTQLQGVCGYCLRACLGDDIDLDAMLGDPEVAETDDGYSDDEQAMVEKRLADLGYV